METTNGMFKGETKQALKDMGRDISDLKFRVEQLNQKVWIIMIILTLLAAEKAPSLIGTALAYTK